MSDKIFTKIATDFLVSTRDLVDWGIEGGHTTPDEFRLTVTARQAEAKRLTTPG